MKSIAIYYRVSTGKQELSSQRDAVEQWLKDLDEERRPKRSQVFQDEGYTGKTDQRPAYQSLLKAAHAGKFDTIVVYRLDRFSRNASDAIKTLLSLDEAGVAFISVSQPVLNLGHENPFRRTMLAAFAEIAEIERQTIVSRVKAGLDAAKARGVKLGAPSKASPELRSLVISKRAAGQSYRSIAKELELSYGAVYNLAQGEDETRGESP